MWSNHFIQTINFQEHINYLTGYWYLHIIITCSEMKKDTLEHKSFFHPWRIGYLCHRKNSLLHSLITTAIPFLTVILSKHIFYLEVGRATSVRFIHKSLCRESELPTKGIRQYFQKRKIFSLENFIFIYRFLYKRP